jgi:hypothetical protein
MQPVAVIGESTRTLDDKRSCRLQRFSEAPWRLSTRHLRETAAAMQVDHLILIRSILDELFIVESARLQT